MTVLKVQKIGDDVALVLDETAQKMLGLKVGDAVDLIETAEGALLSRQPDEASRAVKIGRDFVMRYRRTFDALAK